MRGARARDSSCPRFHKSNRSCPKDCSSETAVLDSTRRFKLKIKMSDYSCTLLTYIMMKDIVGLLVWILQVVGAHVKLFELRHFLG